ncbi:hypothetical protein V8C37DRAFT_395691 [Trichoderma ceciliae]
MRPTQITTSYALRDMRCGISNRVPFVVTQMSISNWLYPRPRDERLQVHCLPLGKASLSNSRVVHVSSVVCSPGFYL